MISTLHQLSLENETARCEAKEMKKGEELKKETKATRIGREEVEEIKILSERNNASGAQITISRDKFDAWSCKGEDLDKLSKKKVVATVAQVEVVKASEHEAKMRLEMTWKLIEGIMTKDKPVGGELRRVRFPIQKKKSNNSFVDVLLDAEDFAFLRARREGSRFELCCTGDFMRGGVFKGKGIDAFVSEIFIVKKALEMVRDMKLGPQEIYVQSDSKNVADVLATLSMDPGLQYFTPDAMPEQFRSILHEERIGGMHTIYLLLLECYFSGSRFSLHLVNTVKDDTNSFGRLSILQAFKQLVLTLDSSFSPPDSNR
ncbi:hypothetical protein RHSIM_Rhsim10G0143500 [Rhododendron simsii]|uniref:Uncharacterized protein n=1 Tax=Rhododendron simsii TaxID=118357 RepID=A0A834GEH5_RHOSS|nr:hypothetical protein RHSIM_Rhsim10G0143500 [Rhododendron simsii]